MLIKFKILIYYMCLEYNISNYSLQKAEELNVVIKQSIYPSKKLDVFKNDVLICSIGNKKFTDYPTLLSSCNDKNFIYEKRRLFKKRNKYDRTIEGFYTNKLLW